MMMKKKRSCKGPQRCCKEVDLLAMRRGMTIPVMPGVRPRELEVDRVENLDCLQVEEARRAKLWEAWTIA
jgi:hypothetical protein